MTWSRVLPVVCRVCTVVHSSTPRRSVERKIHNPFSFFDGEGTKVPAELVSYQSAWSPGGTIGRWRVPHPPTRIIKYDKNIAVETRGQATTRDNQSINY